MNILQELQAARLSYDDCGHEAMIVEVGPELAQRLLALNFDQNRKLSKRYVSRLASDMRNGEWGLSNDAIVLSKDLEVGNAQHRLNAIIQSRTSQKFLILFGSPRDSFNKFDTGMKRTMEQRITISGTEISTKECCIVRHAMNDYSHPQVGTVQYGYQRHDALVASTFLKHKQFLELVNAKQPKGPAFFWAAALKMYAEMTHYGDCLNFKHDHDPLTRAQLFVDLCRHGYSSTGIASGPSEIAAHKLRNTIDRKKDGKQNIYWNDKNDLRVTITAAYKFMLGENVVNIVPPKNDPFHDFLDVPSTNVYEGEPPV